MLQSGGFSVCRPGRGGDQGEIVVTGEMRNFFDYVKLTDDGRVFRFGEAPGLSNIDVINARIVDMEVNPSFSGYLAVTIEGESRG